jgi:hypothetical protein
VAYFKLLSQLSTEDSGMNAKYSWLPHCILEVMGSNHVLDTKNLTVCMVFVSSYEKIPEYLKIGSRKILVLFYNHIIIRQYRPCRSTAVRRWLPTAAARVRVRAACGICGGQSGTGPGFLRVLRFPLPIIPPISPLS